MGNKGINGEGLAHLWDKITSILATKKEVQDALSAVGGQGGSGAVQEIMVVSADFSFETLQVTNFSRSYADILQFVTSERIVKLKIGFYFPGGTRTNYAIGELTAVVVASSTLVFNIQIEADLGAGSNMYLFHIEYYSNNSSVTRVRLLNTTDVG
ncbi:MAG: hypothetical protein IKM66_06810 [Clostridia bacterium]|nr:hypothetical protein [Clostridia bacterium]